MSGTSAAAINDAWITITSSSNGTGNGVMSYSVDVNTGGVRSGMITVAGQAFTVRQGINFADVPPNDFFPPC